ncbi:MAG: TetR/AcrR family transcriptional regulator [Lutibacter sp.]
MKEKILKNAAKIFLKYGFKSTTMDDVAEKLAISKKTIYKYFRSKEDLVDQSVSYFHQTVYEQVNCICEKNFNAIEENFEIKKMFRDLIKNSNESPLFQLQKYYRKTYEKVMKNEFQMFKDCISQNITKGMEEGLYQPNLKIDLVSRFYFILVMGLHDSTLFKYEEKTLNQLEIDVLAYHTRAIATKKGLQILEEQLVKI